MKLSRRSFVVAVGLMALCGCSSPVDGVAPEPEQKMVTVEGVSFAVAPDMDFDKGSERLSDYGNDYWIKGGGDGYTVTASVSSPLDITGGYETEDVGGVRVYWAIEDGTGAVRFNYGGRGYSLLVISKDDDLVPAGVDRILQTLEFG